MQTWNKTHLKNLFRVYGLILLALIVFSFIQGVPILFTAVLVVYSLLVFYCFGDLENRGALLIFLIAFFLFLLGGEITRYYFGIHLELEEYFNSKIDTHAYIAILISLIFCFVGFSLFDSKSSDRYHVLPPDNGVNQEKQTLIRKICELGMVLTFIPVLAGIIEAGIYVHANGYLSYYTTFKSTIPVVVQALGNLFPLFLFLYLATMPNKRKAFWPLLCYFVFSAMQLATGRRLMIGKALLFIFYYLIIRQKMNPKQRWLTKKKLITAGALMVGLVLFFYAFKYVRYGKSIQTTNILDMFVDFFNQQGVSIQTLKLQKLYSTNKLYFVSFYWTLKYLRTSFLTRWIFGFPQALYAHRSIASAFNTNNLAAFIEYNQYPGKYLAGYGYGTSFIAESYNDLGYFGVALVSFIYGFILNKLFSFKMKKISVWRVAIAFAMLEEFIIAPRYSVDIILKPFMNISSVIVFIGIIIFVNLIIKKENLKMTGTKSFSLGDLVLKTFKKYYLVIILVGIIVGACGGFIKKYRYVQNYVATAQVAVINKDYGLNSAQVVSQKADFGSILALTSTNMELVAKETHIPLGELMDLVNRSAAAHPNGAVAGLLTTSTNGNVISIRYASDNAKKTVKLVNSIATNLIRTDRHISGNSNLKLVSEQSSAFKLNHLSVRSAVFSGFVVGFFGMWILMALINLKRH